jgi:release factor glutamine methyltransferase
MTVGEAYRKGKAALKKAGSPDPDFDASCLFQKAFGSGRQERIINSGDPADGGLAEAYFSMIRERANGRPLQYILGEWPFCGLMLDVGEGVLIPREETELLVRVAAGLLGPVPDCRVLDLCAGTGAVGLALASLVAGTHVFAAELCGVAFEYLKKNIRKSGLRTVSPICLDVLEPCSAEGCEPFDAVVSNPPYVCSGEISSLQSEVRREPREALDGGEDGLRFYRAIAQIWLPRLKPGGVAAFEVGDGQAPAVQEIMEAGGLCGVEIHQDFNGIGRVVSGRMKS